MTLPIPPNSLRLTSESLEAIPFEPILEGVSRALLLTKDLAERQPPEAETGGNRRQQRSEDGRAGEAHQKEPRRGQMIRRRVEHVLQHRDEHLREEPAEQGRQGEPSREHDRDLAPEK